MSVIYDAGGHEYDYVLHFDNFEQVPRGFADSIQQALGDEWTVSHRGTRLEITPPADRDDQTLFGALQRSFGDIKITL